MYGKAPKMTSTKKTDTYKDANSALKGAKKRGEPSVTFMIAVGKPMPKNGKSTAAKMGTKAKRGK